MELNIENVEEYTSGKMIKSMEILKSELSSIRTGRANTSIIESLKINVYNSTLPLNQLASINIIDASLININAWDKNNVEQIINKRLQKLLFKILITIIQLLLSINNIIKW